MSIKRAVELNFVNRLQPALANTKYKVVESANTEERPMPCVIVIAGNAQNPFEGLAQAEGNYEVDLSIVVMSNIDNDPVNEHFDATQTVVNIMSERATRRESIVDGLYLYDVVKSNVGEDNQDRKLGAGLNYKVIANYTPVLPARGDGQAGSGG